MASKDESEASFYLCIHRCVDAEFTLVGGFYPVSAVLFLLNRISGLCCRCRMQPYISILRLSAQFGKVPFTPVGGEVCRGCSDANQARLTTFLGLQVNKRTVLCSVTLYTYTVSIWKITQSSSFWVCSSFHFLFTVFKKLTWSHTHT